MKRLKLCDSEVLVVTPDLGSIKLARDYARQLETEMAIVDKLRSSATHVDALHVIGDVEGKDVLLADDLCSTAGTLVSAAKACREKGAKRVFAAVTHGLLVGDAVEKIEKSPIEALFISNSIPAAQSIKQCAKIRIVSIAELLGQAISCIISKESISSLYSLNQFT